MCDIIPHMKLKRELFILTQRRKVKNIWQSGYFLDGRGICQGEASQEREISYVSYTFMKV